MLKHSTLSTELAGGAKLGAADWNAYHDHAGGWPWPTFAKSDMCMVSPLSLDGSGSNAPNDHALYFAPIIIGRTTTFNRIGHRIITGSAGNFRLGVWRARTDGYPGALLLDSGNMSGASSGTFEATINLTLDEGLYWLGHNTDMAGGSITMYGNADSLPLIGYDSAYGRIQGVQRNATFGAFVDETAQTHTTVTTAAGARIPLVHLRFV